MRATARHILNAAVLMLFAGAATAADRPALTGTAVDASGAALPGVTVTLTPVGPQAAEPALQITNESGAFGFDEVGPGTYAVTFALDGFRQQTLTAVVVPASTPLRVILQIAGLAETVLVRATTDAATPENAGEATFANTLLTAVPLATERFEDALPLLPGTLRGPDGLLNMKGGRADQSSVLVNGVNMTDPVTGHASVRLPVEAVDSLNVHAGVFSAVFGDATAGVTDVVVKPGTDKRSIEVQNFMPRPRIREGGVHGFDAFTPRVRVSGPIRPGRVWFSESANYRFVRTRVDELQPLDRSEQKVQGFDFLSQIDLARSVDHHVTTTFMWFPSNIDNAGIDTLHPFDATPNLEQRGWSQTFSDRLVLGQHATLTTNGGVKNFDMNVAPKHDGASTVSVNGIGNNYFNRFDRNSRRIDAGVTLATEFTRRGDHLVSVGGQFARTTFDGIDQSGPVQVIGRNGDVLRTVSFVGDPTVTASNSEGAAFIEDKWALNDVVTLQGGLRYAYDGIAAERTVAPRVEATVRAFSHTVIKSGAGVFTGNLPLNADSFEQSQARLISDVGLVRNRVGDDGLRTPTTRTWNVEVDQQLAFGTSARIGYRNSRGSDDLVVDPLYDQEILLLSSHGRTRSQELETTLHQRFQQAGELTVSYVRSSTKGDLNDYVSLFGDVRDPIIRANEYGPQAFDVPNRVLAWGVMNLPRAITVAPTIEYRSGFPYTTVDEQQSVVGARNRGGRYPALVTADLAVTKEVAFFKGRRARVGAQVFNLTGHFNPRDVQNNVDSPDYGRFANSADRQVRAKFTLLF
jgi:carboxypeptidase family protein